MTEIHWRVLIIAVILTMAAIRIILDARQERRGPGHGSWNRLTIELLRIVLMVVMFFQLIGYEMLSMNLPPVTELVVRSSGVILGVIAAIGMTWPRVTRAYTWGLALTPPDKIKDHFLATHGLYRFIRHPFYAAMTLGFIAIELTVASYLVFPVAMVFVAHAVTIADQEENDLEARYGDEFRKYKARTWRFVPFVY